MDVMTKMRELFHGIPNRLNAISVISFTSADVLERAVDTSLRGEGRGEILKKTRQNMKMIDDAYRACLSDLELLRALVLGELEEKEDAEKDLEAINGFLSEMRELMETSNKALENAGAGEENSLILSLTGLLYTFENISAETAKRISGLKKRLMEAGRYSKQDKERT
jgi:hypothetical protein